VNEVCKSHIAKIRIIAKIPRTNDATAKPLVFFINAASEYTISTIR
jgi:hypothetical protein